MAPALTPVMQSIGIFSRSSTRRMPTWAMPWAKPPPSARPMRGIDFTKTPTSSYICVCNDNATDQSPACADRNRIHHVPVLFQSPDGRVRALGHGADEGIGVGHWRHFHHAQLPDRVDSRPDRLRAC